MQDWELKMTNDVKDSFTNIRRQDDNSKTNEKDSELNYIHTNGSNRFVSKISTSNSIINSSHPSIIHGVDSNGIQMNRVESSENSDNIKDSDSKPNLSEIKNSRGEEKNYLNFFSLPMYGLKEKSTQTDMTGRDIEDLDFFRRELSNTMHLVMRHNTKDKTELIKKLYPFLEDKKINYSLTIGGINPLQSEVVSPVIEKNFIQIKRKSDNDVKSVKSKATMSSSTPNIHPHPHLHLKVDKQTGPKRRKKEDTQLTVDHTNMQTSQTSTSKEEDVLIFQKSSSNIKQSESTPFKLINTKKSVNMLNLINEVVEDVKHSDSQSYLNSVNLTNSANTAANFLGNSMMNNHKKDFTDSDFNISEIINDIKNSTRKELNTINSQILTKKDSQTNFTKEPAVNAAKIVSNLTNYDEANGTNANTSNNQTTEESNTNKTGNSAKTKAKNKTVKKFDAYYFFKSEFQLSKQYIDEDELEKSCRKEWNLLDKETKKIYNINAEREKKIHKLNKKKQKTQEEIR